MSAFRPKKSSKMSQRMRAALLLSVSGATVASGIILVSPGAVATSLSGTWPVYGSALDPETLVPQKRGGPVDSVYFTNWSIYGRNFKVSDIPDVGNLDVINYGFINAKDGKCQLTDPWADTDITFSKYPWSDSQKHAAGNLRELHELKKTNPYLHIVASVGGWTLSKEFPTIAATQESRTKFVNSCVSLMQLYDMDGLDIDWEFPVIGGAAPSEGGPVGQSAADKQNFTLLMRDLRAGLDKAGADRGRHYELSAAVQPSATRGVQSYELSEIGKYLDYVNVMAYDYNGAWDNVTGHNAPLMSERKDGLSVEEAIKGYIDAGVPANKILVGLGSYGRSFAGVSGDMYDASGKMVRLPHAGAGYGTWEKGVVDYDDLVNKILPKSSTTKYWDPVAKVPFAYDSATGNWYSYDDAISIQLKANLVSKYGLGGSYLWEASADRGGALMRAAAAGMAGQVPAEPVSVYNLAQRDEASKILASAKVELAAQRYDVALELANRVKSIADSLPLSLRGTFAADVASIVSAVNESTESAANAKTALESVIAAQNHSTAVDLMKKADAEYLSLSSAVARNSVATLYKQARARVAYLNVYELALNANDNMLRAKEAADTARAEESDASAALSDALSGEADATEAALKAADKAEAAKSAATDAEETAAAARKAATEARAVASGADADDTAKAAASEAEKLADAAEEAAQRARTSANNAATAATAASDAAKAAADAKAEAEKRAEDARKALAEKEAEEARAAELERIAKDQALLEAEAKRIAEEEAAKAAADLAKIEQAKREAAKAAADAIEKSIRDEIERSKNGDNTPNGGSGGGGGASYSGQIVTDSQSNSTTSGRDWVKAKWNTDFFSEFGALVKKMNKNDAAKAFAEIQKQIDAVGGVSMLSADARAAFDEIKAAIGAATLNGVTNIEPLDAVSAPERISTKTAFGLKKVVTKTLSSGDASSLVIRVPASRVKSFRTWVGTLDVGGVSVKVVPAKANGFSVTVS